MTFPQMYITSLWTAWTCFAFVTRVERIVEAEARVSKPCTAMQATIVDIGQRLVTRRKRPASMTGGFG